MCRYRAGIVAGARAFGKRSQRRSDALGIGTSSLALAERIADFRRFDYVKT